MKDKTLYKKLDEFLNQLESCEKKVVTLEGDKFMLCIPPHFAMSGLADLMQHDLLEDEEIPEANELLFGLNPLTSSIFYTGEWNASTTFGDMFHATAAANYARGQIFYFNEGQGKFPFRACLVPLTRDEKPDYTFFGTMSAGDTVEFGAICESNGRELVLSREMAEGDVSMICETPLPIKWYHIRGVLVSARPVGISTVANLLHVKLIPYFANTDDDARSPSPAASGNPILSLSPSGDPDIDAMLNAALAFQHREESRIPIGSQVRLAVPTYDIQQLLIQHENLDPNRAIMQATNISRNPATLVSIVDVQDDDGSMRPYATIRAADGNIYHVWTDMLQPA